MGNPDHLERIGALFTGMDAQNTAELKRLMARWGWFTSARFGAQTENNAWLIVQHADADPEAACGKSPSRACGTGDEIVRVLTNEAIPW